MSITEIIRDGFAKGDSYEVINKRLADAGFNLKLVARENTGWTEKEMNEGFQQGEPTADVKHLHDYMRLNMKNAGKTVRLTTPEGTYDITWNENGNPVSAVRVVK